MDACVPFGFQKCDELVVRLAEKNSDGPGRVSDVAKIAILGS